MNPSKDVLALSSIEVDLAPIVEGQGITVVWQGKPIFVRRRTAAETKEARETPAGRLLQPEADAARTKPGKENWVVLVGICTHLGCIPTGKEGEFNGWFCPCHGSTYDVSGRIRSGPAPSNLEVPDYAFLTDTKIKIG